MNSITAQLIATLIQANCDAHLSGGKSREAWKQEQDRLWKMAAEALVASEVMRLVCPSLTISPHTERKQMRERTLAVGR